MTTQAKVKPRQVAAYQSLRAVTVDEAATCGAQIGVNLLLPDGSVGTLAKLQALFGSAATVSDSSTISTTDDLEEGQFNLWFTDRRAQDAVGAIVGNSANVTLNYTTGTSLVADLTDLANTGAGALLAITRDGKGRVTGTRAATITGTAGRVTVTNGDASTGLPTIDLATVTDAGGGALLRFVRDVWGRVTGTSAATTDDLTEGAAKLYYTDARADARIALQKATAGGLATLDGTGKLDASQLPALAISETFVVASQAAMLALTAQQGDVAVRTDLSKSYILAGTDPTVLANWQELLTPAGGVTSFNGRTGSVTPASGDYTAAQVGAEPTIAGGTAAQFWQGDKTWQDFATAVRAAVLTGLSTATSAVIAATDTVLGALGKLQAQITDNLLPKGYIDGLQMQWVSGTALTVTSGAAYIEGSSKVLRASAAIAKAGLSLAASTWYHIYLYDNAGTPDVELSTTAPASPYRGTARSKTGDTSRRYVGSVLSDGSGHFYQFSQTGNKVTWWFGNTLGVAPFRALSGGTATTATNVALSGVIPSTSKLAFVRFSNADTAQPVRWSNKDMSGAVGASGTSTAFIYPSSPNSTYTADYPTASDQSVSYWFVGTPTSTCSLDVYGFVYER